MKRQPVQSNMSCFPSRFHSLLEGAPLYDSSCSPNARVWFIDRDDGYYLKASPKGSLQKEGALTRFFHAKGLGAEVLDYACLEEDWLLTRRIPGEDCIFPAYLDDPKRLCDTLAEALWMLHSTDPQGCPIPNRTADYLAAAERNYRAGHYDLHLFSPRWSRWQFSSPEEAWQVVESCGRLLKADTLIHGDYCLPNIMLDNWKLSGFLDLDTGGVGDRHVDLFWATWSLQFNLHTDAWRDRFLDAYGRSQVEEDLFRVIAAVEIFG